MAKRIEVTLVLNDKDFTRRTTAAKAGLGALGGAAVITAGKFTKMLGPLAALAAGLGTLIGSFKLLGSALDVSKQFADVETTLTNLTGSAAKGRAALNQLITAAEELPISFEELARAQPALATISPTLQDLQRNTQLAADIAGNFGIPFEVAAGQLQRSFSAGAGAADVFREKGVLAAAGFEAGVSVSVEETIAKFRELETEISGAAQSLNRTLTGSLSQAGDAFTLFQKELGDAVSPELKAGIDTLVEAFRANKEEILGFANSLGTTLVNAFFAAGESIALIIDLIATIKDVFLNVFNAVFPNFSEFFQSFKEIAGEALRFILDKVFLLGEGFGFLLDIIPGMDSRFKDFFAEMRKDLNDNNAGVGKFAKDFVDNFGDIIVTNTGARDSFRQFKDEVTSGADEIRQASQEVADAAASVTGDAIIDIAQNANAAGETTKNFTELLKQLKLEFMGIETMEEYRVQLARIDEMLKTGVITFEEYKRAKKALDEAFEEGNPIMVSFGETVASAGKALSEDLAVALTEGKSVLDSFKNFFKRIINQLIADALRMAIIQPILSAIFGIQFTPGGGFGGFKATGGPVLGNTPYIVGERGPELFVPKTAGTIVPNDMMGGVGGRTAVTYNINAVDALSFKQMVARDPEFIYNVTTRGQRRIPQ